MEIYELQRESKKTFVVEGAKLECSLGTKNSTLNLPIGHGVFIHDKKQANVSDYKSLYNISSFCNCRVSTPPPPCIPDISMHWLNGKADVVIADVSALLNTSIIMCACGGVIKIIDDGQM